MNQTERYIFLIENVELILAEDVLTFVARRNFHFGRRYGGSFNSRRFGEQTFRHAVIEQSADKTIRIVVVMFQTDLIVEFAKVKSFLLLFSTKNEISIKFPLTKIFRFDSLSNVDVKRAV